MLNYKTIREAARMTVKEMAAYLGVCARSVRRYEAGDTQPGGPARKLYEGLMGKIPHTVKTRGE